MLVNQNPGGIARHVARVVAAIDLATVLFQLN
jgi:hypothetical protein